MIYDLFGYRHFNIVAYISGDISTSHFDETIDTKKIIAAELIYWRNMYYYKPR